MQTFANSSSPAPSARAASPLDPSTRAACTRAACTRASEGVLIAGGGLAAQRCTETLRRAGFDGRIRLLCAESDAPYDRPPLSKSLLSDPAWDDRVAFRPAEWYRSNAVDVLAGVRAEGLEADRHRVRLSDGSAMRYGKLLIATGGRARTLPLLTGYENVSVLRTLRDARDLRNVLTTKPRLGIIGAGFIGLEVAATARRCGAAVHVVEAATVPLRSVLGERVGSWLADLHRSEGVVLSCGASVASVVGVRRARALLLSDGTRVEVDHILVGVGIAPDAAWLTGSGVGDAGGVPVDQAGRTLVPDVFAAGDVAATWDADRRRHVAGSHWEAAVRQATSAARLMIGDQPQPPGCSTFWSDQYGMRIQYAGARRPDDELTIEGDMEARSFTGWFTRAGQVVAGVLVNRPRDLPRLRKAIERRDHDLPGPGG